MRNKFTIAIVTRKRQSKLKRCLESIVKQRQLPDTVLVIDNDSEKSSRATVLSFTSKLHIIYAFEAKPGIANARNKALVLCQTPLLGFVDDDCILRTDWVKNGLASAKKSDANYILGKSLTYNMNNLVALAKHYHQTYWFRQKLDKNKRSSPFNLDTKNIIFKIIPIRKMRLRFDPSFSTDAFDSSDTDFGFQLSKAGFWGIYQSKMVLYHEEQGNLLSLFKKAYKKGALAFLLAKKYKLKNEFVDLRQIDILSFLKNMRYWPNEYRNYTKDSSQNAINKIASFLIIKVYERIYLRGFLKQAQKEKAILTDYR